MRNVARHKPKSERPVPGQWTGPRYFKVYTLSPRTQRLIRDRIQRSWTTPQIFREINKRTRERIALRTLQSFCMHYRNELAAREEAADQMRAIAEAALKMGQKLTAAVQAQLLLVLFQAARAKRLGPYHAGKLAVDLIDSDRKGREFQLRKEVARRRVRVEERKADAAEGKGRKARTSARPWGRFGSGSPADAIRAAFGIPNKKDHPKDLNENEAK